MSKHGHAARFPWRKEAETPAEPQALIQAVFRRELARNDEEAAKRLAAEAQGLHAKPGSAAADRAAALERAAQIRAHEAEHEREIADRIVEGAMPPEGEAGDVDEMLAALREEAERLRAACEVTLAEHARAIDHAAEKRARRTDSERAGETRALLSNAADRISKRHAKRLKEKTRQLSKGADEWRAQTAARLAEGSAREVEERAEQLAEQAERRHAKTDARLDAALNAKARALGKRLANEAERRHQELVTSLQEQVEKSLRDMQAQLADHAAALEQAGENRAQEADAARAGEAASALAEMEKRLSGALADQRAETDRIGAQTEALLAEHAKTLEQAGEERAQKADAARADHAASALAAMEKRLSESLTDHGAETDRIREQGEVRLAEHVAALEQAGEERAQEAAAARTEQAGSALAAMERRVSESVIDRLRAETDRILEQADARLAESKDRLEQLAAELQARIADADRETGRASAEAERYLHHLRTKAKGGTRPADEPGPGPRGAPLDANEATLDDLRGLRLSLTQATRMLSFRDALGGFTSLDQLDEVPGISDELRNGLKRWLAIPAQGAERLTSERTPSAPTKSRRARPRARR